MTWVMLSLRKATLKSRISDLEQQQLQLSQRIQDLQTFSSAISSGTVSHAAMASCPPSLFGNYMQFMATSSPVAYEKARLNTDTYLQQYSMLQQATGGQYALATDPSGSQANVQPYLIFNDNYKKELQTLAEQQVGSQLHAEEKELESKRLRMESQLKAAYAELESVQKQEDQNIKSNAIQLA